MLINMQKDKPKKGETLFMDRYPEAGRIAEKIADRRRQDKPIDGQCMKEHSRAMEEIQNKHRGR